MGLFNLSRLCLAVFLAPSLVFASGKDVRVGVSPTTSYSVKHDSVRVPPNAKVSGIKDVVPVTSKVGNSFEQTMRAGITIEAKKTVPFSVKAKLSAATMARGAKAFLKSGKANPYVLAGSLGLQALLDGVDWIMDEGGKVQKIGDSTIVPAPEGSTAYYSTGAGQFSSPSAACSAGGWTYKGGSPAPPFVGTCHSASDVDMRFPVANVIYVPGSDPSCPSGSSHTSAGCVAEGVPTPVPASDIDNYVDEFYLPDITDFVAVAPFVLPDSLSIDPIPNFYNDPITKTIYDGAGNPVQIQETNSYVEFTIDNSVTSNPSISTKTNTETKTYEDGVLVGSSTTSKDSASTEPDTSTGGGGGISVPPNIEIPTDCDFHPTICAWLEWTKKDDDIGEEVDLRQLLHEEDYEKTNTVSFGSKSCPEPLLINLSVVDSSYELSFQPICTLAEYMYYFIMAASYIFAAYIALGVSRNG